MDHTRVSPWTAEQWMNAVNASDYLINTYVDGIQCPSGWTPDQWIKLINPLRERSYNESAVVQRLRGMNTGEAVDDSSHRTNIYWLFTANSWSKTTISFCGQPFVLAVSGQKRR